MNQAEHADLAERLWGHLPGHLIPGEGEDLRVDPDHSREDRLMVVKATEEGWIVFYLVEDEACVLVYSELLEDFVSIDKYKDGEILERYRG